MPPDEKTEAMNALALAEQMAPQWAQAAAYTHQNSKRYRAAWGQHVGRALGPAVAAADRGMVRLRIHIAPDGSLAQLHTLWRTSALAEQRVRQAVLRLPPLPPTPTGEPLVFDKTFALPPSPSGDEPIYANDCQPQPAAFRNPFAWQGGAVAKPQQPEQQALQPDPQALAECLRNLPPDSAEANDAHHQRQLDRWGQGGLRGAAK